LNSFAYVAILDWVEESSQLFIAMCNPAVIW